MHISYKQILFGIIVVVVGVLLLMQVNSLQHWCSLERIKDCGSFLADVVKQHYGMTALIYIFFYAIVVAASLPITGPLGVAGGFMFGFFLALFYSIIGGLLGAFVAFSLLRRMTTRLHSIELSPRMARLKEGFDRYGYVYLLILHFTIVTPFVIINSLAAFSTIPWHTFLWVSALGMTPAAAVYVYAGTQLAHITSLHDVFSWHIIAALALLAILVLLPLVLRIVPRIKNT